MTSSELLEAATLTPEEIPVFPWPRKTTGGDISAAARDKALRAVAAWLRERVATEHLGIDGDTHTAPCIVCDEIERIAAELERIVGDKK